MSVMVRERSRRQSYPALVVGGCSFVKEFISKKGTIPIENVKSDGGSEEKNGARESFHVRPQANFQFKRRSQKAPPSKSHKFVLSSLRCLLFSIFVRCRTPNAPHSISTCPILDICFVSIWPKGMNSRML